MSDNIEPAFLGIKISFFHLINRRIKIISELLIFYAYLCAGRYRSRYKCVTAYDRIFADYRFASENRCSRVDRNIVFNSRMTLFVSERLSASC